MKPYYTLENNRLYHGDCLNVLKEIPGNSIDNIVTDPPYGYSFMGKDWDKAFVSVDIWKECLRVLKEGAFAFVMSAPRQDCLSEMISRLRQAGFNISFTSIYWTYSSGFSKVAKIGKMVSKRQCAEKTGIKKQGAGSKGSTFPFDNEYEDYELTDDGKALDGSYAGYQPKPAVEVIIVAMKPITEKTYVEQALKNGKGITWIDGCRIPYESEGDWDKAKIKNDSFENANTKGGFDVNGSLKGTITNQGRFPANLICSDDVLNDGKVSKSVGGTLKAGNSNKVYGEFNKDVYTECPQDSGSYSRYFDLDKWWVEKIKSLPESVRKVFPFLIVPKASKSEKNRGCDELEPKVQRTMGDYAEDGENKNSNNPKYNIHPTVKPVKLMSYLITLGSQPKDVILDPFLGSGTTCVSADLMGRQWIGIEISEKYCEIAKCRIEDEARQIKMY